MFEHKNWLKDLLKIILMIVGVSIFVSFMDGPVESRQLFSVDLATQISIYTLMRNSTGLAWLCTKSVSLVNVILTCHTIY